MQNVDNCFFNQNPRNQGLPAIGEKGQGIFIRMMTRLRLNQTAMVRNFSGAVGFRLARAEPMVATTIAANIMVLCSIPKNRIDRS